MSAKVRPRTPAEPITLPTYEGLPFVLHQEWLSGEDGGFKFTLTCGAGLGNGIMQLRVEQGDESKTEYIDMREAVIPWVNRMRKELNA